jgi:hypothetical protein
MKMQMKMQVKKMNGLLVTSDKLKAEKKLRTVSTFLFMLTNLHVSKILLTTCEFMILY